jgi:uncharacterized protein (TIGR03067 family)
MRKSLLLLTATLSTGFAPAPFPKPTSGDLREMQGTWMVVQERQHLTRHYRAGARTPAVTQVIYTVRGKVVSIVGKRLTWRVGETTRTMEIVQLDLRKTPKQIDFTDPDTRKRFLGIYRLEGDKLTLCYAPAAAGRPSQLGGDRRSDLVMVLQRKKP